MLVQLYGKTDPEELGFLPSFLSESDPRTAREQLDANYQHGGGWSPMKGWTFGPADRLSYTGDPAMKPLAEMSLRGERVLIYPSAWVVVVQPDGSFEVSRMD